MNVEINVDFHPFCKQYASVPMDVCQYHRIETIIIGICAIDSRIAPMLMEISN